MNQKIIKQPMLNNPFKKINLVLNLSKNNKNNNNSNNNKI